MNLKPLLIAFALLAALPARLFAADPTLPFEGSGTADSPYLLKTAADIKTLADACAGESGATSGTNAGHYQGVHFAITADIDMSGITGFYGIGSAPDGSSSGISWYFAGIIDGRGHTVSNMRIEGLKKDETGKTLTTGKTGSRGYVGFIGTLKNGGGVQNLHFDSSCIVRGYTASGTVVGQAEAGCMIRECSSAATVENIYRYSGGIVGYLKGSSAGKGYIYDCVFTGTVRECYEQTGGIAGRNERGVISKCVNLGKVEAQSFDSLREPDKQSTGAGIAGYNYFGTVENCMNAGYVFVSYQKAGGIVGYNSNADCDVHGCINTGRIDTPDKRYVGAIVAHNFRSGSAPNYKYASVGNCYFDSQLRGNPEMLAGYQIPDSAVVALPTLSLTSGDLLTGIPAEHWTYSKGFYPRVNTGVAAEAIEEAAAAYVVFPAGMNASDFSGSATVSTALPDIKASMAIGQWFTVADGKITAGNPPETVNDTIRLTQSLYTTEIPVMRVPVLFEGEGTEQSPYLISDKAQLMELAARCNGDRIEHFEGVWFRQTADIDMKGVEGFDGIASKATNAFNSELTYYFSGHYDGGGFSIRNLKIAGVLFAADGTALDYTKGSNGNVGLFGALGKGAEVSNLRLVDADIEGYYNVGGIAGFIGDGASIADCEVSGTVKAYNKAAGGIAGSSDAPSGTTSIAISRCSVSGQVTANSEIAGGIIGYNHAVVSECANMADVSVKTFNNCVATPKLIEAGGIAGSNCGNIADCANFGNVYSGWTEAGGIAGYNTNGYRKGNITRNVNAGQTSAADLTYAGSVIGLDYRITTSQASKLIIEGNIYDSQVSALLGSENIDKEGIEPMTTAQFTSGTPIASLGDKWRFAEGRYPIPSAMAESQAATASALYLLVDSPASLFNFGASGVISPAVAVEASLEGNTQVFSINSNMVKAAETTQPAEATLTLTSAGCTRSFLLSKAGAVLPGNGTIESPYLIATPADFNKLSAYISANRFGFPGSHFKITADLDFSQTSASPLGDAGGYFAGTLDGDGHTLSNVRIAMTDETDYSGVGLFRYIGQEGTVRNLRISDSSFTGVKYVGAVAGHCMGRIENCTVSSSVIVEGADRASDSGANTEIGGIAGRVYPTAVIAGSSNAATVTGSRMVGGIVGASRDTQGAVITNCTNEGSITGTAPREAIIQGGQEVFRYVETMVGGIAGRFTGRIDSCTNSGEVQTTVCNAVGGILGKGFIYAEINGCLNKGKVSTAYAYAGGIVGISTVNSGPEFTTLIDGCTNSGVVAGLTSIGGIAGVAANGCRITSSCNTAEVKPMMGRGGGIVGEVSQMVSVADCFNTGEIEASMNAGGIVGEAPNGSALTISRSFNAGNITAGANGGASGIANSSGGTTSITDCYNTADITAARFVAGISGRSSGTTITRCYSSGTVTANSSNEQYRNAAGHISADPTSKPAIANSCFYAPDGAKPADALTEGATEVTPSALFESGDILGDAFVYAPLCLPRLASSAESDAAKANSVFFTLEEGETRADVLSPITLGTLEGTQWSAQGAFEIADGKASPTADGEGSITATAGDFSRTYSLIAKLMHGVDDIEAGEERTIEWYTLDGRRTFTPRNGEVLVEVTTDARGKRTSRKVIIGRSDF